jgi:hypothetical protein
LVLKSLIRLLHRPFDVIIAFIKRPKKYVFLKQLLVLALAIFGFAFAADISFEAKGQLGELGINFIYKNSTQPIAPFIIGLLIIIGTIWLYYKIKNPSIPKSEKIRKLEDMYNERQSCDSVCELFRETYRVPVTQKELTFLMEKGETPHISMLLKKARKHVELEGEKGFTRLYPRIPYKLLNYTYTLLYAFSTASTFGCMGLLLASFYLEYNSLYSTFISSSLIFLVLSMSSLFASSTFNSVVVLTSDKKLMNVPELKLES